MPQLKIAIEPVTAFRQNCALIWDDETKHGSVIDPGGDVDRLLETLDKLGLHVDQILLTHGHIDHAGGADRHVAVQHDHCVGVKVAARLQRP